MKTNNNLFRTQNGGIHAVSKGTPTNSTLDMEKRPRSVESDNVGILHAGIVSAHNKKTGSQ